MTWICPNCSNHNQAGTPNCLRCQNPRAARTASSSDIGCVGSLLLGFGGLVVLAALVFASAGSRRRSQAHGNVHEPTRFTQQTPQMLDAPPSLPTATISTMTGSCNLRASPGTGSRILRAVHDGTTCNVLSHGQWTEVECSGARGFVHQSCVRGSWSSARSRTSHQMKRTTRMRRRFQPANRSAQHVLCNDGTRSPTCRCDRGSFRGCCSHHGGIAGCF